MDVALYQINILLYKPIDMQFFARIETIVSIH